MIWLALIFIFSAIPAFGVQQPTEEKVVVTANAYPVPFENLSRTVTVFTREDIGNLPAHSVADILAQAASVDVRSRSSFGMQADLSVRGSAFSQVLVLVDGMRINDSQTGHHNADFPMPLQDIERVEVLLGPGSSIYGADALGGIVNIITLRQTERIRASITAGQDGFVEGSFSAGLGGETIHQSISVSANRSSGFQYDRDFQSITASARTSFGEKARLRVSHVNKEFGANGFYGPAPSKEWTNQTMVAFERMFDGASGPDDRFSGLLPHSRGPVPLRYPIARTFREQPPHTCGGSVGESQAQGGGCRSAHDWRRGWRGLDFLQHSRGPLLCQN